MARLSRGLLATALALTTFTATAVAGSAAQAEVAPGGVYVAMGDSYTAGPLILPMSDNFTCARSARNYPALLAAATHPAVFRDVSCSSATSKNFSQPQSGQVSGTNPPQYDAITPDTTLVTVGIGGNDVGLVGLAESCVNVLPESLGGKSCAATYTAGGVDQYSQRIQAFAPTYGVIIDHIRALAPNAQIVMVGYPTGIKPNGCFPVQPILPQDANYVQAKIDELNSVMAAQAAAHGALYADTRTPSIGHDACQLPGIKWLEGLVPTADAFPLHPNELGMVNDYRAVQTVLG
ncbi:MAG TPA: SGNH/GDSL hydrolase family protein [Jatrophihabitantaceae bacterium]|nr:SGNH/GDSL hydrolase family protein [Jatrophihabitantaceae bacterium]